MIELLLAALAFASFSFAPVAAPPETVVMWGQKTDNSSVEPSNLPSTTSVQAANWGGLALSSSGTVYSWKASPDPVASQVSGPTNVVSIGEGGGSTYGAAVTSSGDLWTWGNDQSGQLCNGRTGGYVAPTEIHAIDASSVSGGQQHLLILTAQRTVSACGNNAEGQLGNDSKINSDVPVAVRGLTDITQVSAGNLFSLALDSSGHVYAWGNNDYGQLGDGNTINSDVPVEVPLPDPAVEIYAGGSTRHNGSAIALLKNGQAYSWGDDSWGELGDGNGPGGYEDVPVRVDLPQGVTIDSVVMGGADTFVLASNGDLYGWGADQYGQLGNGIETRQVVNPEKVASDVSQISAVASIAVLLES
jgi:alpha-tubulin suppressor-like RCC1 family protein